MKVVPLSVSAAEKKIAIVCGSPSSEMLAPFGDESYEIWVLGNRFNKFVNKRVTRIFEIHDDLSEHGDPLFYANWLIDQDIPLVVGEGFPLADYKHVSVFPFEEVNELYGQEYLTSSSAYMMAMAILEGATHIGVYGVDMAVDDHEYFWQRPCMEAWIGFAKGKGINVYIPDVSHVGKCDYVEGRESGGKPQFSKPPFTEAEFRSRGNMHANKISELEHQISIIQAQIQTHDGARQTYERLAQTARGIEAGNDIKSLSESIVLKGE